MTTVGIRSSPQVLQRASGCASRWLCAPTLRGGARQAGPTVSGRGQSPVNSPCSTHLSGEGWRLRARPFPPARCHPRSAGVGVRRACVGARRHLWPRAASQTQRPVFLQGEGVERQELLSRDALRWPAPHCQGSPRRMSAGDAGEGKRRGCPGARFGLASDHSAAEGPLCAALDSMPGGGRDIPGRPCGSKRAPGHPTSQPLAARP